MSEDLRILLFAIAVATSFLAIFQHGLVSNGMIINSFVTGQNVIKELKASFANGNIASASASATAQAEAEESPAQKTASASATLHPRVTASPTATAESTPNE